MPGPSGRGVPRTGGPTSPRQFTQHRLDAPPLLIAPPAIASSEAVGSAGLVLGFVGRLYDRTYDLQYTWATDSSGTAPVPPNISPSAIASVEALGSPVVTPGPVSVAPAGIASAEAFGTARLDQAVTSTGIASTEAFGSATVTITIAPTGIASAQALGSPSVVSIITPTGIASSEAFGTARLDQFITPTGIASAQVFGNPTIGLFVGGTGIASAEAFGTPLIVNVIAPTGIASAQAFGTPTLELTLFGTGIPSAQAFGAATIVPGPVNVGPTGIATAEAFGTSFVDPGGLGRLYDRTYDLAYTWPTSKYGEAPAEQDISPTAISSAEAFGATTVVAQLVVSPTGIASAQAFGTAVLTIYITPAGIASAEAFGSDVLTLTISSGGIASAQAFGAPRLDLHVTETSIPSAESFGTFFVDPGGLGRLYDRTYDLAYTWPTSKYGEGPSAGIVGPIGIASDESFGTFFVDPGGLGRLYDRTYDLAYTWPTSKYGEAPVAHNIAPSAISFAEAFGTATVVAPLTLFPAAIASAEAFGTASLKLFITPTGIASAEVFGAAQLKLTLFGTGIPSAEAFGSVIVLPGPVNVSPTGISSAEAFGTLFVDPGGLGRLYDRAYDLAYTWPTSKYGEAPTEQNLSLTGIGSAQAFGNPSLVPGIFSIGIASDEAFGTVLIGIYIAPTGIASAQAFGAPAVSNVGVLISPSAIASAEAFGLIALRYNQILQVGSIVTAEAFGSATVYVGPPLVITYPSLLPRRSRMIPWRFFLANSKDMSIIGQCRRGHDRRLSVDMNKGGSASLWLPINDKLGAFAVPWRSCIIAQRGDEWMWSGPVQTRNTSVSQGRVTITAVGWFERLMRRYTDVPLSFANQDAGTIAFALLAAANNKSDTRIRPGNWLPTQLRTLNYPIDANVGQEIQNLAELESGYDWYIDPITRQLVLVPRKGVDLPDVKWTLIVDDDHPHRNQGNLLDGSEILDGTQQVNDETVRGKFSSGHATDDDSIYDYDLLEDRKTLSDVVDKDILNAYANEEIVYRALPRTTYAIMPRSADEASVPRLFEDFQIGDTNYLTLKRGIINVEDQAIRIFGADIAIDDAGVEKITRLTTNLS